MAPPRVWLFDLDNTLHDARVHIFPSMHLQINEYIKRKFAVDEAGANAIRAGGNRRGATKYSAASATRGVSTSAIHVANCRTLVEANPGE